MKIVESSIDGVDILAARAVEPAIAIPSEALPFTAAIRNRAAETIALIGVRFDMKGPRTEKYSVVYYADTLRDPTKGELRPGCVRAICAEPSYTNGNPDPRARMNLANLRSMLYIAASLDCVAFADGRFEGPDSRGALHRINQEREAEQSLLEEVLKVQDPRPLLTGIAAQSTGDRARVALARKLLSAEQAIRDMAAAHRFRIPLWRS